MQILMGAYRGEAYLPAQLDSIAKQSYQNWQLRLSIDSLTPSGRENLFRFSEECPQKVEITDGPRKGFAENYMSLMRKAPPGPMAFSDQDDIWLPTKLERAMATLTTLPASVPVLYCAKVYPWGGRAVADRHLSLLTTSTTSASILPGFKNSLIENVARGNTIVLNSAASELAQTAARKVEAVFAHDWWLYQLISGVGGTVIFDEGPPVLLYRQHASNAIGAGIGIRKQLQRKSAVLKGVLKKRLSLNAQGLSPIRDYLTSENAALFDSFQAARQLQGPARLLKLKQMGVYRQTRMGTLGFFGSAALGLI